jgi:hypothetical protein
MVLATIVEDERGLYEISGEVLPFGVFDNEDIAKSMFDDFIKENSRYSNHMLDVREVELNKPYDIANNDSPEIVSWMYIE